MKIEIDKDKVLYPGDVIEMHFKAYGLVWLRATQWALIESQLEKETRYKILAYENTKDELIVRIEIVKPWTERPPLYTAGITASVVAIGITAAAAGLVLWLTLDKVYQITSTPTGQAMGLAALAIPILIMVGILRSK